MLRLDELEIEDKLTDPMDSQRDKLFQGLLKKWRKIHAILHIRKYLSAWILIRGQTRLSTLPKGP
jgi:hypothetical protein